MSVRAALVRTGVRIEIFTVLWMVVEAAVSLGAGVLARSALLVAFGIDSVIELVSGAILLWCLRAIILAPPRIASWENLTLTERMPHE